MEISTRARFAVGLLSPKHQARQEAKKDVQHQNEHRQAEAQRLVDDGRASQLQDAVAFSDEMAMVMTQFRYRNRREYDKKSSALDEYYERVLDDEAHPKAQKIIEMAQSRHASAGDLLRHARSLFPDDSDLVIVLRELLKRRQLDEVVRKRLQALLEQVSEEAEPKALKAGINCALKARLFGKILSLKSSLLRASYRQFLASDSTEIEIYTDWISSYGHQRRMVVLDFIEGALLTDIDAQDPSCSQLEFGHLLARLNQLKLLRSTDNLFIGRMLANPLVRQLNSKEADWLLLMLSMLQYPQPLDSLLVETVGDLMTCHRHGDYASLLQTLYQVSKSLPERLFLNEDMRDTMLAEFLDMAKIAHCYELAEKRREAGF